VTDTLRKVIWKANMTDGLPRLNDDLAPMPGRLRAAPEDFVVDEIPAYLPSGEGEHLFVRFEKRDLTTPEAVRRIAAAVGADARDAGWAGLKDRHAVTTQWASFARADRERALAAAVDGVRVLEAMRHGNKLRTGHLVGNAFTLRVRDVPRDRHGDASVVLERLARTGVPNYFGEQRFGVHGRNLARARAWLVDGGTAPRDRFERKLLVSVLQSSLFNEVAAARVRDGLLGRALDGDILRVEESGGLFISRDPEKDDPRVGSWELSPTGPMFGARMRAAEGATLARERAVLVASGLDDAKLERFRAWGEGTRRVLRVRPSELSVVAEGDDLVVAFALPKGAYATVVMRELLGPAAGEVDGADAKDGG